MEFIKNRKLGIRVKILVPSIVVLLLVCVLMSSILNKRAEKGMVRIGGQVAQSVAKAATGKFNLNQLANAVALGPSANTDQIVEALNAVLESYESVTDVYIVSGDKEKNTLTYVVSSNGITNGTLYDKKYEYLADVFENGNTMSNDSVKKSGGRKVITAYAPIKNDNKVICAMVCDYDATEISSEVAGSKTLSFVIGLICAILASGILAVIVSSVVKNLNIVNKKVSELASNEGDLTQTIQVTSGDETQLIADNFNILLGYIRTIMLSINDNADLLKNSSGEIVRNLGDANTNVADISSTMEQMSAAMRNTSQSIEDVATQIMEMNEQIELIYDKAKSGSESTDEINQNAENIRIKALETKRNAKSQAEKMAVELRNKIEKSKEVSEIETLTKQILNITGQTRLLSLNASIEAARAGESGRGFSVVAEEIGKLANESGAAAGRIQQVSQDVVSAVSELATEAEKMITFLNEVTLAGFDELEETSTAYSNDARQLRDLMEMFAGFSKNLREYSDKIKSVVNEVNVTADETSIGISNISDMTNEVAQRIADIEKDAVSSEAIATTLNGEVNKFKLN